MAAKHQHSGLSGSSHDCCSHQSAVLSINQTMDEMEFERGIWSAALNGEEDRLEKFLNGGTDPNARDSTGYAPLHYAARSGHVAVCQMLLRHGADVNIQTRAGGATPLHRAAYCGHHQVVQLLLDRKAEVLRIDADGQTATHKAAERAQRKVIQILVAAAPVSMTIKDNRGRLPLACLPGDNPELLTILQSTTAPTDT